jgi:UDP-glucose 4-epimerase
LILVTGGTGFVGRHLTLALAGRGERVRVLSRRPLDPELVARGIEGETGDLRDEACCARCLAGATAVIHLAASPSRSEDEGGELWATNVEATRALGRMARQAGLPRFVHVSSAGVYGDSGDAALLTEASPPAPVTAYQRSKLESEKVLLEELSGSATSWTILRPYGIYGPGRRDFFRDVQRKRVWFYGSTRVTLHPTYVGDVVQVAISALDRIDRPGVRGEIFNVGGERPIEHFDFVRLVASRLQVRAVRVALPSFLAPALRGLAALGVPGASRFSRRAITYAVDTSKARSVLGFAPRPLLSGVDETIGWARREGLL